MADTQHTLIKLLPGVDVLGCMLSWLQSGVRGYQKVEEYDPIERMKRLATGPAVSSLEEELKHMQVRKVLEALGPRLHSLLWMNAAVIRCSACNGP